MTGKGAKATADKVEFALSGAREQPTIDRGRAVPLSPEEASAGRFAWARDFRRTERPHPREIVLAQFIAECVNTRPKDRGFGTAWSSRERMADETGLALKAVDNALRGI